MTNINIYNGAGSINRLRDAGADVLIPDISSLDEMLKIKRG